MIATRLHAAPVPDHDPEGCAECAFLDSVLAEARREGWDAALAAVRNTEYPAGLPRSAMVTAWLADVLDRLASEGPR